MVDALLTAVRRYADSHADADGIAATPIAGLTIVRATERGETRYALLFTLDLDVVEELAAEMHIADDVGPIPVGRIESDVADAALRLVRLLERPSAVPILKKQFVRELHYWLMAGPHGPAIRALAASAVASQ